MAGIVGFPNFAASSAPLAADLDLAAQKIVEQIGGVDGDGVTYPGNIDSLNLAVFGAGFTNDQKLEPRSIFAAAIQYGEPTDFAGTAGGVSLPVDAELFAISYAHDDGGTITALSIEFFVDEESAFTLAAAGALTGPNESVFWAHQRTLPAGTMIRPVVTKTVSGTASRDRITFWFKALHRRVA